MAIARLGSSSVIHDASWGTYATLTTSPTAASLAVSAGDFLICRQVAYRAAGGVSVTFNVAPVDSQSNGWTLSAGADNSLSEACVREYYAYASATGTLTVNIRANYDVSDTNFIVSKYSGVLASSPILATSTWNTDIDTTTIFTHGMSAAAGGAGDLISGVWGHQPNANSNFTVTGSPTPSTLLLVNGTNSGADAQGIAAELIASGAGTQTLTFGWDPTGTSRTAGIAVAYGAAASTGLVGAGLTGQKGILRSLVGGGLVAKARLPIASRKIFLPPSLLVPSRFSRNEVRL